MTKILPALLSLAMMTGAASAQQRTFYDAGGKVVGRSATDSSGTTTNYDARAGDHGETTTSKRRSMMRADAMSEGSARADECITWSRVPILCGNQ